MDNTKKTKITLILETGKDLDRAIQEAVDEIGLSKPELVRLGAVKVINELRQTGSIKADKLMTAAAMTA